MPVSPGIGRVAAVTGGARGAGRAIAERLASDGFRVSIGDVDKDHARRAAAELTDNGYTAVGLEIDVADSRSVKRYFDDTVVGFGSLHALINNAGVISIHSIADLAESEWDRVLDIDLKGVFLCTQAALPHLRKAGWGRIVNMSSQSGKCGEAMLSHYNAAKFGVIGFTQATAMEVARDGITANAVCPTIMETRMMLQIATDQAAVDGDDAEWRYRTLAGEVPLGRAARPSDVAALVSYLCRDEAEFITGESVNLTGGNWMA